MTGSDADYAVGDTSRKKIKICIIAQNAFGAITGSKTGYRQIGGVQNQVALIAPWLAERGHDVSVVVWDEGQQDAVRANGVSLYKTCSPVAGIPLIRFFYPRMTSLHAALRRADADVYYHNAAEAVTGLIAAWCRREERRFVCSVAAELSCHVDLPLLRRPLDRHLYRFALRNADRLIVQTRRQRVLLRQGFGLDAVQLPMPCAGPCTVDLSDTRTWSDRRVLWVGRVASGKRLEWLLEIAARNPETKFEIVGANAETPYAKDLYGWASNLPNVSWLGTIAPHEMARVYARATCLCCTSAHEGFPNIFLEAWSHGKPVVSSFDPDNLIRDRELGKVGESVEQLSTALSDLLSDRQLWIRHVRNARRYYEENHRPDDAMRRFEKEMISVSQGVGRKSRR